MANQPKKYKKFVATAATATLVASAIVPVAASAATPKFPDIAGTSYEAAINAIADLGVVSGYTDGTFKPYNTVDRAGVVKFLGKFLVAQGETLPTYEAATANGFPFSDLTASSDKELVQYAALVKAEGVFTGYTDGTLNPTQEMPRHQMASVLVKAIKAIYGIDLIAEAKAANFVSDITDIKGNVYEEAIAALDFAGLTVATQYDPSRTLNRGQFANFLSRSIDFVAEFEANKELKVASVTAINGTQVEVKFTKAVKKSTVITGTDTLANVVFNSLETPAKEITEANAKAVLSEDGKTLTITAGVNGTQEVFEGRYQVVIDGVQDLVSVAVPKYDEVINLGKDTVSPTIKSTTKVNATTTKVTFSEVVVGGSVSYKLADGTVVPTTDVTVTPSLSTASDEYTFKVDSGKYVGKTITATFLGAVDAAGNLLAPNPSTFSLQVGDKDGVAPTVTSLKSVAADKLEVVFSEEVQGFATTVASDAAANFTLTGGNIASGVTATKIEQDSTDKKKYIITLSASAITSPATSALGDAKVIKTNITDLSGEPMAADFNSLVTITADTTEPTLVSSSVVTEAGAKYLELVFSEAMDATAPISISGTATSFKDYVTKTDTLVLGTLSQGSSNKVVRVALADTKFATASLIAGTKYDFKVTAKDANGVVTTAPIAISFTNEAVASTNKPEITNQTSKVISASNVTNDKIELIFDRELDGASATNVANYSISGVKVKSATLAEVSGTTQTVTLTLDTNELTGNRSITVANVKSKAGVVMDTFTGLVGLTENVKPEVKSAKITGTKTIEVSFSEAVQAAGFTTNDDFVLKVGTTTIAATDYTVAPVSGDATKATITLSDALTTANLAETITLETLVGATDAIKDAVYNTVKVGTVTVSK